MEFYKFYVSSDDLTFLTPEMVNRYPMHVSFKEKYRKALENFKTYFISKERFNRINSRDYTFMNFDTKHLLDYEGDKVVKEYHHDKGIIYQRSASHYHPVYKTYMIDKLFTEEPSGWLYFESEKDLLKFKMLLG